jgi:hypothetical protein
MSTSPGFGAFVISLDLELYWGVRDFLPSNEAYWENLRGERKAIRAILDVFEEFGVAATWATVGFLFAGSPDECESFRPNVLPEYKDAALSPYGEFSDDASVERHFLFAPDQIELIRNTPRQEIGTHTFSHYYCLEPGQTPEAFEADIESAVKVAGEKAVTLRSIVFPRNQHNPQYDQILLKHGISCYRGNQSARMYQFDGPTLHNPFFKATRLADTFVNLSGNNTLKWDTVWRDGMANVAASIFLRPVSSGNSFLEKMQFRRIARSVEFAARNNEIFHLWWHPHNFGTNLDANIGLLRKILTSYQNLSEEYGIRSLTMTEVAEVAAGQKIDV